MNHFYNIEKWAEDRGILEKGTIPGQLNKLREEVQELMDALYYDMEDGIIDALGDCVVVLTILAKMKGLKIEDCIEAAYLEISDRKGKMVDGVFVKEGA